MVAARTGKASGPAQPKQMPLTGLFGTKPPLKLQECESFLLHPRLRLIKYFH